MGVMNAPALANVTASRKARPSPPTRDAVSTAIGIISTTVATGVMTLASTAVTT